MLHAAAEVLQHHMHVAPNCGLRSRTPGHSWRRPGNIDLVKVLVQASERIPSAMNWAAVAAAPVAPAAPADSGDTPKPRVAVVDANALITQHGLLNLVRFADKAVTTPEVRRAGQEGSAGPKRGRGPAWGQELCWRSSRHGQSLMPHLALLLRSAGAAGGARQAVARHAGGAALHH